MENIFLKISRHTLSVIWSGINVILMLVFVCVAYGGYVRPEITAIPQLLNLVFPLVTGAAGILLLINLFLARRIALLWILTLLAAIGPILTFCPLNFGDNTPQKETSDKEFTLLTYNILDFGSKDGVRPEWGNRSIAYVIADSADIVCLQEGADPMHKLIARYKYLSQADTLRRLYPYISTPLSHSSNAVLSKFKMSEVKMAEHDLNEGKFQAYWLKIPSLTDSLLLVNVHLESFELTDSDKSVYSEIVKKENASREELREVKSQITGKLLPTLKQHAIQARRIATVIDSINPKNVIVCGDFNDVCGSFGYRYLCNRCKLNDAYADAALGPTVTYNDSKLYFHIDQILYRGNFKAKRIWRGNLKSSDHYPLTTLFECEYNN